MFALDVQNDPKRALELARLNVKLQREPIDLLVFARAAAAARDDAARGEVKALMQQIGLKDARVDATL
jgi:predicted hydrocarbon binding protein